MTNRKRILLASCAVILLCTCIIAGMTYALFTDSVKVSNHLQAGDLDVTLTRTSLKYAVLNDEGYLEENTVGEYDFTKPTDESVFGIKDDMLIVPGSYFDADMKLTNTGNVAFTYTVKLVLIGASNDLSDQLEVTVTHPDGTVTTKKLSELTESLIISEGEMAVAADGSDPVSETFSVKVEFLDDVTVSGIDNDKAQDKEVYFDLVVEAVQATKKD